jgi:hypothetical protein
MAVNTPTAMARGAFATSSATIYTVPASTTAIITSIALVNTSASQQTVTLLFDSVAIFGTVAILPNSTTIIDMKQVMTTTKIISGFASAVSVNYHISGVQSV